MLKAKEFLKDYVINPSTSKSYCDKQSLKTYGVMPSQKGKVTQDELEAIASYMFEHFTQQNLAKEQAIINKLRAMPKGKQIALKNNSHNGLLSNIRLKNHLFESPILYKI